MTPRAVEVLRSADLVLAEDTRTSAVLMKHFEITTPMASHHKFNEHDTVASVADRIESGQTVALLPAAGTPGISDPGFLISRECRSRNLPVETLPGATAFVPALVSSGLPCDRFFFEGFLPQKKGRATRLEFLAKLNVTFVVYESPLRLARTLAELAASCGPLRPAAVCREISKLHETIHRGTLAELAEYFTQNMAKGEIVIVVGTQNDEAPRTHRNKYKEDL